MNWDWYKLFNLTAWLATGLVQRTLVVDLGERGQTAFLITQGNTTAVKWEDRYMPVSFLGLNPYEQDGVSVFKDSNDDVWIGFEKE